MPEISIVLPSYNGEKYIKESVESVRSQKFKDWELIIVDDCSTDHTPDIAEDYAKKDSRIIVHHNRENLKLPRSLNVGFHMASGKYLTWTSDDNVYLRYALEDMHHYLEAHLDEPMVCAGQLIIDADGRVLREYPRYSDEEIYLENLVGACFLYRRELLTTVGDYDAGLFCVEDYDYWLRILKRYGKIGYMPGAYYLYRYHSGRLSETKQAQVQKKLGELWLKNREWIVSRLPEDTRAVALYDFGLIAKDSLDSAARHELEKLQPELAYEKPLAPGSKIILYGTGDKGVRALSLMNDRVIAFTKSNTMEGQTYLHGLPVIPLTEAVTLCKEKNYQIVIAAGRRFLLEMMDNLLALGLRSYSFFPRILETGDN